LHRAHISLSYSYRLSVKSSGSRQKYFNLKAVDQPRGAHREGGRAAGLQPPKTPKPKFKKKKTGFVDIMISKVLRVYPSADISH
jgi:hypothetical protein